MTGVFWSVLMVGAAGGKTRPTTLTAGPPMPAFPEKNTRYDDTLVGASHPQTASRIASFAAKSTRPSPRISTGIPISVPLMLRLNLPKPPFDRVNVPAHGS